MARRGARLAPVSSPHHYVLVPHGERRTGSAARGGPHGEGRTCCTGQNCTSAALPVDFWWSSVRPLDVTHARQHAPAMARIQATTALIPAPHI